MTRWKAISLVVLSMALLLTACGGPSDAELDLARKLEAEDLAAEQLAEDLAAAAEPDAVAPEDDTSLDDDTSFEIEFHDSWRSGKSEDHEDNCDLPEGVDPVVVPAAVIPTVNGSGDLEIEVEMCHPVNFQKPFGHLYSGYFLCPPPLNFGSEWHAGTAATLGDILAAYALPNGNFYYNTGRPPPDPFPLEFVCEYGNLNESGGTFFSGNANMHYHGRPGDFPDSLLVPLDATTFP
jgi:hypothetical protein